MKRFFCFLLIVLLTQGFSAERKILLFTCQYGAGHKMATQGIVEALKGDEVKVVDIYDGPLAPLDPMRSWMPSLSNEHLYNEAIKKEWNPLLNFAGHVAPQFLFSQKKKVQELLTRTVSQERPDLLISCVPLVNGPLLAVAKALDIPLLVVTTDIDISAFCVGLPDDLEADSTHFQITVPYEKETWDALFAARFPTAVSRSFHYGFGYPTRAAFSQEPSPQTLKQLRALYEIRSDEELMLIMMGGNASHAAKAYARLLLASSDETLDQVVGKGRKLHVICLCGDTKRPENHAFMQKLNEMNGAKRVRIHGCPATPQIAELVSLPEMRLVISKPGGSTVGEMIKKRVFTLYHTSSHALDWEKGNIEYAEARGYGKRCILAKRTPTQFFALLVEAASLSRDMRSALIPEAQIDFADTLRQTVDLMLEKKEHISKNRE